MCSYVDVLLQLHVEVVRRGQKELFYPQTSPETTRPDRPVSTLYLYLESLVGLFIHVQVHVLHSNIPMFLCVMWSVVTFLFHINYLYLFPSHCNVFDFNGGTLELPEGPFGYFKQEQKTWREIRHDQKKVSGHVFNLGSGLLHRSDICRVIVEHFSH